MCSVEEELAQKEGRWLQLEAKQQRTITSLERELELEREQHSKEVQFPPKLRDWGHLSPNESVNLLK